MEEATAPASGKTLKEITDLYFQDLPDGAKAENSLYTEKIHVAHLLRLLRGSTELRKIGVPDLQAYVKRRGREVGLRGKRVQPETIRKELATFRLIWNYAKAREWVSGTRLGCFSREMDTSLSSPALRVSISAGC